VTDGTDALWNAWTDRRDERAFEALVGPELRHALGFARRLGCDDADAQDAVQDALARLASSRDGSPVSLGIRTWLCREVHVRARSRLRSERRRRRRELAVAATEVRDGGEAPLAVRDELERALGELDGDDRAAVELRHLHDLDYFEMAQVLGVSEQACRQRVHRALARLRSRFGDGVAALVAALPLPPTPDVPALVKSAMRRTAAGSAASAVLGAIAMTTKAKLLAASLVLVAAALATWRFVETRPSAPEPTREDARASSPPQGETAARRPRDARRGESGPGDAASGPGAAAAAPDAARDRAQWAVRVVTNVPGARVTVSFHYFTGESDPPPETKTADAQGSAGFALPQRSDPVASCAVAAEAEGFATARKEAAVGEVRLDLEPGIAVRGRVVDEARLPVKAANVSGVGRDTVYSEADGTFAAFTAEGGDVTYHVWHPNFLPVDGHATAPARDVLVVLRRGLTIGGRVAFADLHPVSGVAIVDERGSKRGETGDDGRYVVSGLPPGPVTLRCSLTNEARTADAGAADVDFTVTKPVARVRLVDEDGRPVRRASLWMRVVRDGKDLLTSATNGTTGASDLVQGTEGARLLISPSVPGFDESVTTVEFGDGARLYDVDAVLHRSGPKGVLRLHVQTDGGQPPSTVYVTLENESGSSVDGWYAKPAQLDADGRVEIPATTPGSLRVTVASGSALYTGESCWLPASAPVSVVGGRTSEVDLTMPLGGRVRVTVLDALGTIVAPDRIDLLSGAGERLPVLFVHVKDDGSWTTKLGAAPSVLGAPVPAGRYVVSVRASDGGVVTKDVDVVRGTTGDVEVSLPAK
jgi:RNA polymerase sigma-70 factor (ECF subfamily)